MSDPKQGDGVNRRLGGPPGLYDSPNRDRDPTGGIYQRVRVPDARRELIFPQSSENNKLSLNDSDNAQDAPGIAGNLLDGGAIGPKDFDEQADRERLKKLEDGVPMRKTIRPFDLY